MSVAVGIDLGTTNSCVAICQEGQVQIIPNREQERITPSFVFYSDEGTIVGRKAKSLALLKWSNAVYDFKRIIGKKFSDDSIQKLKKSWSFTLAEGENHECRIKVVQKGVKLKLRAEEVSAEVLRKLKEDAEFFLQKPVSDAVITVPAYFNNLQRRATEDAAKIAGLKVLKLINEPTAAALAFGQNSKVRENKSVLVYDLGGGTFDVSIVNFEGDSGRIIVAKGDNNLGGIDFDRNLLIHVLSQIEEKYHIALEKFTYDKRRRLMSRILSLCEHAKKELSQKLTTAMILDHFEGQDVRIEIAREKFEDLNLKLFQETIEIVAEAVQKSNLEKIDHILLVGGSTKIPKVRELIRDCFGVEPNKSVNPLEAVAAGAAIQAAGIINSSQVSLTDVIPLSLGVEVVANETMNVLIKSSEKIPASVSKKYYTIYDYQTDAIIKVYEGSAKNVEENVFLDEVCIRDITPKPAGEVAFTVTFAVDLNGILTVTATEDSKNMRKDLTILLSNSNRMTVEEIAKSIERMKCNKAEDD